MDIDFKPSLTFDDLLIQPRYSEVESRGNVSLATNVSRRHVFDTPIVASPMDTVCEVKMAKTLAELGGLGVLHRFVDIDTQYGWVRELHYTHKVPKIAVAVGVVKNDLARIDKLGSSDLVDIMFVDTASGDNILAYKTIEYIKAWYPHIDVVSGSICTYDAAKNNRDAGVSALRVGVGNGAFCSTRITAGVGVPQATALYEIVMSNDPKIPIIADGGIRMPSDLAKAIGLGASAVMLGGLLVGTDESPGALQGDTERGNYKMGRGMASHAAQESMGKKNIYTEGVSAPVPYRGTTEQVVSQLLNGLRSAMSYCGADNIETYQRNANMRVITNASLVESHPHIFSY